MKKFTILITALSFLLSGCATILNGKYQKIAIDKKPSDEIMINGEKAKTKNGKYLFQRDLLPKQITVKSEGFKDENLVIMQYKKSPLHILSWIPFGILFYPPFLDKGHRSWDFDNQEIVYKKSPDFEEKSPEEKEIKVNKVGIDLEKENIKSRYFPTYKNYLRKEEKRVAEGSDSEEEINVENTIFSLVLNDLLMDKGYIDTTRMTLKNSYLDNLLINATIKEYTVHHIANRYYTQFGGMLYVDLSIDWEVLDYYKKPIYSLTTTSRSGEFAILDYRKKDEVIKSAIKDVMENGLIEFMRSEKVNSLLTDKSEIEKEKNMKDLDISRANSYVNSLSESIKSSLTIKSKKGFGSGFIISSDGYIITNYHVVAEPKNLKVILNDKSEHEVEIVRVSKIYDLALLKIDAKGLVPYNINRSKDIQIASEIFAIGTPTAEDLSQTISKGIVSGIREVGDTKLIQTDASINSGNSGGPLINRNGEVVGVVSSKLNGFGVEGVAFGIPAYEILDRLKININ